MNINPRVTKGNTKQDKKEEGEHRIGKAWSPTILCGAMALEIGKDINNIKIRSSFFVSLSEDRCHPH